MKLASSLVLLLTMLARTLAETPARPLTIQERLGTPHLQATHEARLRFARERQTIPVLGVYEDFRAVTHVHAEDSDDTKGTRQQALEAARKSGVCIVMFTDHGGPKPDTWRGMRQGILFIAGNEDAGAGFLRFPNPDTHHAPLPDGELRFLSHIEERLEASPDNFAGMEICTRRTDTKLDPGLQAVLDEAARNPDEWRNCVDNFKMYPDEFFGAGTDYRPEIFAKWDRVLEKRPFTGIGANGAHPNRIFQDTTFNPYEVSFRNVCTHILARELTEPEVRRALREGHVYVSHDWLCDPTGFVFGALNNFGAFPMGDTAIMMGNTRVVGLTPLPARLKLIHQGQVVKETVGTNLTFVPNKTGAYRLEAWLHVDGEDRPWIYSNPVYVKAPSLSDIPLPFGELPPNVEIKKDLDYTDGKAADANKHRLDLYLPKDRKLAPVFLFIHGGAWRTGDRAQYPPLGNRFAKEGILTVVPSYRLAPKNPHPAQIEDVAAAFAWTVRHIGEYGGDTNRIYLGGHSAGGHLAALLSLDERYLKAHGLSPKSIRGTITLSGVFDLSQGDNQASVFGRDKVARREASPLFHVQIPAPPFLVSYCQWDYPTLPAQARAFHAALQKAGATAELVFVPHESHISEMIAFTQTNDPTALTIMQFIHGATAANTGDHHDERIEAGSP